MHPRGTALRLALQAVLSLSPLQTLLPPGPLRTAGWLGVLERTRAQRL